MNPRGERLFCSKPFRWFEASGWYRPKGDVFLCCPTWLDQSIGNLQFQSVEDIWNGQPAQEIRRSILDGTFEYCNRSRCPFLQTVSGPVQFVSDVVDDDLREVIQKRLTVLPWGPKEINCTYDKSCNLSCPSCRTQLIVEGEHKDEILAIQERLRREAFRDAELLYITGSGDPFGSPFFYRLLRTLRRADVPALRRLHLHTNAQLWTPKTWAGISDDLRPLIRSAEISIDAARAETYAINRRRGSFERLLENLKFVSILRRDGPLADVTISMVVQENNFAEMSEFVALGKRFGFDTVYFSKLVNWGTFSQAEYEGRAVHKPRHPRHGELVALLQAEIFQDPIANLGNLNEIR
jgi:MoaA/NifB/PqqE/SkfB family radical SAM enzyme